MHVQVITQQVQHVPVVDMNARMYTCMSSTTLVAYLYYLISTRHIDIS